MSIEEQYLKHLRERSESIVSALVSGRIANFPEYAKLVGEYQGILFAVHTLNELVEEMQHDDD